MVFIKIRHNCLNRCLSFSGSHAPFSGSHAPLLEPIWFAPASVRRFCYTDEPQIFSTTIFLDMESATLLTKNKHDSYRSKTIEIVKLFLESKPSDLEGFLRGQPQGIAPTMESKPSDLEGFLRGQPQGIAPTMLKTPEN